MPRLKWARRAPGRTSASWRHSVFWMEPRPISSPAATSPSAACCVPCQPWRRMACFDTSTFAWRSCAATGTPSGQEQLLQPCRHRLSAFQDLQGHGLLKSPQDQVPSHSSNPKEPSGGSILGRNPLGSKTPRSDPESQEKRASSGQLGKFSIKVISFCMKVVYASIGWSDD